MKIDKKFFYISIEAFYTEEQIQKMFNIVENIEETNMPSVDVYNSLKLYKNAVRLANEKRRRRNYFLNIFQYDLTKGQKFKIINTE